MKCVTLLPGRWIFVCPCGFRYIAMTLYHKNSKVGASCLRCKSTDGKFFKVMERDLKFKENPNNKLNCKRFTILRRSDPIKYCIGATFKVYLNGTYKGTASIISTNRFTIDKVNRFISSIDMGCDPTECKRKIMDHYKQYRQINWETQLLDFCLLEYHVPDKSPNMLDL